jgi:hypothetical protein
MFPNPAVRVCQFAHTSQGMEPVAIEHVLPQGYPVHPVGMQ